MDDAGFIDVFIVEDEPEAGPETFAASLPVPLALMARHLADRTGAAFVTARQVEAAQIIVEAVPGRLH